MGDFPLNAYLNDLSGLRGEPSEGVLLFEIFLIIPLPNLSIMLCLYLDGFDPEAFLLLLHDASPSQRLGLLKLYPRLKPQVYLACIPFL